MKNQTKRIPYKFLIGAALFALGLYLFINYDGKLWYLEVPAIVVGVILCVPGAGKSKVAAIALGMLLAFGASAQSSLINLPPAPTNNPPASFGGSIQSLIDAITPSPSNVIWTTYASYASDLHKWGGGIGAFAPILTNQVQLLTGVRLQYINRTLFAPSGNASLGVPLHLFGQTITPFATGGADFTLSGQTIGGITIPGHPVSSGPALFYGYGAAWRIYSGSKVALGLIGGSEQHQNGVGRMLSGGLEFKTWGWGPFK